MVVSVLAIAVVWIVWNGSLTLYTAVQGLVLAVITLVVTNRFLLKDSYPRRYQISVITFLRFLGILLVEIYRSGVHAIYVTVTNRINIGIIDLPTSIDDPLRGVMVASAITLTPGTVTIDYDRRRFKVVWIDCPTTDPDEAGEMIKGSFERVLQERPGRGRVRPGQPE